MTRPLRSTSVASAFLLVAVAAGCSGGDDGSKSAVDSTIPAATVSTTTTATAPQTAVATSLADEPGGIPIDGSWTVMLYMMADNNLESSALDDLEELAQTGPVEGINIIALVDRSGEYTNAGVVNLEDWEGTKVIEVGDGELVELDDIGEINLGDPTVLEQFIPTVVEGRPADHYALAIWDHGAGWPGVGPDETNDNDGLTLPEIRDAVASGIAAAGLERLDIIGFDACLMGTLEVANALLGLGDFLVASSDIVPLHGWDWRTVAALTPGTSPEDAARSIVEGFGAQATELGTIDTAQMAALDLNLLPSEALTTFFDSLAAASPEIPTAIGRARAATLTYASNPDPDQDPYMYDLGDFAANVAALADVPGADEVIAGLDAMVVADVAGSTLSNSTGLSVYFPPVGTSNDAYVESPATPTSWLNFLVEYSAAALQASQESVATTYLTLEEAAPAIALTSAGLEGAIPIDTTGLDKPAHLAFLDQDGLTVAGFFDPAVADQLVTARWYWGIPTDDAAGIVVFGDELAQLDVLDDGTPFAAHTFDLTALQVGDGTISTFAYSSIDTDAESGIVVITTPMSYGPSGRTDLDVVLQITVDAATADIVNEEYLLIDDAGNTAAIELEPGWVLSPRVLVVDQSGSASWVTLDAEVAASRELLQYDFADLVTGDEVYGQLEVTDIVGATDYVEVDVVLQ